jgi:hypothetical protein
MPPGVSPQHLLSLIRASQPRKVVVAQYQRKYETVCAEHHPDDDGSYRYCVRIIGGKFHDTEIRCRTKKSALWLFDLVVKAVVLDIDWSWLVVGRNESFDSEIVEQWASSR